MKKTIFGFVAAIAIAMGLCSCNGFGTTENATENDSTATDSTMVVDSAAVDSVVTVDSVA